MDAELLGQFCQRLVLFDCDQGHLELEGCLVIAPHSLHHFAPLVRRQLMARMEHAYHLLHWLNIRSPFCWSRREELNTPSTELQIGRSNIELHRPTDKTKYGGLGLQYQTGLRFSMLGAEPLLFAREY